MAHYHLYRKQAIAIICIVFLRTTRKNQNGDTKDSDFLKGFSFILNVAYFKKPMAINQEERQGVIRHLQNY